MYVCICNAVTDSAIREAVAEGATSFYEVSFRTGCGTQCGSCVDQAREVIDQARVRSSAPAPLPGIPVVAW